MGLHCCVWFWGVDSLIPGLCASCFENLENPSPWPLRVTLERRSPACGLWPHGGREPRQPVRVGRGHLAGQRGPTDGLGRRSALGLGDRSAPGRVTGARPRSLRVQSLHPWFPRPFLSGQGISWGRNGGKSSSSHSVSLTCHSVRVGGRWVSGSTVASPPAFWDCRLLEGHPPWLPQARAGCRGGVSLCPRHGTGTQQMHIHPQGLRMTGAQCWEVVFVTCIPSSPTPGARVTCGQSISCSWRWAQSLVGPQEAGRSLAVV